MTTLPFVDSVKAGLLASGWYANRLGHDAFPGVLALCYHGIRRSSTDVDGIPFANLHVTRDTFDAHCRVIAETCHPIDLAAFREARVAGRALPERPVLVTFDDGYRSVFELARPILRRYKIPAAVFVCSEPVRDQQLFWFDAVARSLGPDAVHALRARPDERWREIAEQHETPAAAAPQLAPMTDDQVRQLSDEGFAIGVHTASHAPLAQRLGRLSSATSSNRAACARIVDRTAAPTRWPIRSAHLQATTRRRLSPSPADLGFTDRFTTRNDFARSTGAATGAVALRRARRGDGRGARASHRLRLATLTLTIVDVESASSQRPAHVVQPRALHRGID